MTLRTPLRAIEIFQSLIKRHTANAEDEVLGKYLNNIEQCTQEMNHMIKHLLYFCKVGKEIGDAEMHKEKIEMKKLTNEIFDNLKSLEPDKRMRLVTDDMPEAYADPTLMRLVMVNLLSNAIKYSSKNEEIVVEVKGKMTDDLVEYEVKDNGIGFNMKHADKLFQPFSRLHSSEDFKGTGAGLAIVHKIINFHQGKIKACSSPGNGATFHFSLPQAS